MAKPTGIKPTKITGQQSKDIVPLPMPIRVPYGQWSFADAQVQQGRLTDKLAGKANLFFTGDHWQKGAAWVGPCPGTSDPGRSTILKIIEPQFVSKNAIAEVVNRHVDAVLSRAFRSWSVVTNPLLVPLDDLAEKGEQDPVEDQDSPSDTTRTSAKVVDPNQDEIDELTALIKDWWERRNMNMILRSAVERLCLSETGGLRLFVPQGRLVDGQIPRGSLWQMLDMIFVECPAINSLSDVIDNETMIPACIYNFQKYDVRTKIQLIFAEISYVDPSTSLTNIHLLSINNDASVQPITVDLGGKNTCFVMHRTRLITEQVMQQQRLMNMALTMMSRNVVLGGFLERTIIAAEMPGQWVPDPTVPGGKSFQPKPIAMGGGTTTVLQPIVTEDDEGKKTVSNPSIIYRDPVPVTIFVETRDEAYRCILEDVEQTHMILAGNALASGDARVQARANFATSLLKTKPQVDAMIAWLVDTLIEMASTFSGSTGKYRHLKTTSDVRLDTGPLTPQEKDSVLNMHKSGLMSREVAMILIGTDDIEQEISRIEREKRITSPAELAQILTALSKTGWKFSLDQLPEVDEDIIGVRPRNVEDYKKELDEEANRLAASGANAGGAGGSPKGSTNKPHSDSPGPGKGGGGVNPAD